MNLIETIGGVPINQCGNLVQWTSGLSIDADGDPEAYTPKGTGLDYLANAGRLGDWWGIACTPGGIPYIQCATDPDPGFYVATTALEDASKDVSDPARYVDSGRIPFIVLPMKRTFPAKMGNLAFVFNTANGKYSFAICADEGPTGQIGEGSIALANALGIPSNPKHGGCDSGVAFTVFLGSPLDWPQTLDQIVAAGTELAQQNGLAIPA